MLDGSVEGEGGLRAWIVLRRGQTDRFSERATSRSYHHPADNPRCFINAIYLFKNPSNRAPPNIQPTYSRKPRYSTQNLHRPNTPSVPNPSQVNPRTNDTQRHRPRHKQPPLLPPPIPFGINSNNHSRARRTDRPPIILEDLLLLKASIRTPPYHPHHDGILRGWKGAGSG